MTIFGGRIWLLAGAAFISLAAPMAQAQPAEQSADKAFEAIYTAEYDWRQKQSGPSEDGPKDQALALPDVGPLSLIHISEPTRH